jgi:hypothetical protein
MEEVGSDEIPMAPASIPLHPALKRLRPPNSILDAENVSNFRQTPRTVKQSVIMWGPSLEFVRPEFITYDLCKRAIESHDGAIAYVPRNLLTAEEYHALCVLAVSLNGFVLREIPHDAMTAEIVAAAHDHTCCAIMFTPREFLTEELCWASIRRNGEMFEYVPTEFKTEEMKRVAEECAIQQKRENSARAAELTEQLIRDGQISCPVQ